MKYEVDDVLKSKIASFDQVLICYVLDMDYTVKDDELKKFIN